VRHWQEFKSELEDLKKKGLYRELSEINDSSPPLLKIGRRRLINFSSNNYLALAKHPQVKKEIFKAASFWGAGSGASRLLSGNLKIHESLEKALAEFKREEAATLFSSGYLAGLGAVTALLNEKDLVLVDRLNHASLIDAARLSRAKLWVYPHRDVSRLDRLLGRSMSFRRKLVVTDAYFSMDGDVAPLDALLQVCRRHGAMLMADEAHSTGVFGAGGRGLTEYFGVEGQLDVVMGTLSKALGSVGGFIAGKAVLKDLLVNRCRPFIYTTAPSPVASAAALRSLHLADERPELRRRLWSNVYFLRDRLKALGFNMMDSEGPIIPLLIKKAGKSLEIRDYLLNEGVFAPAIRPPTVPQGAERIRISVTAAHRKQELERLVQLLKKVRSLF